VIALLSLAFGALATAFAGFLAFLGRFNEDQWKLPLVIIGIMLVISAPSMAIAWLKLRKRNLGPILDANGWAVNAKARMNVPFGAALTGVATLPPGATFGAADKFAEKPAAWPKLLVVAFVIWFVWAFLNDSQGRLNGWTHGRYGREPSKEVSEQRAAAAHSNAAPETGAATATNAVPTK
jgi:hypothetical protein